MSGEVTGTPPLLQASGLGVQFDTPHGPVCAARDVDFTVAAGECLGVAGESGAGKSQLFLAALGLLPHNARASGSVRLHGQELLGLPQAALDRVRGARVGLIFQDPLSSLTPHLSIGRQMGEVLVRHGGLTWAAARSQAARLLDEVRVSEPRRRLEQLPCELSGGMRQRVMIAMAISTQPALLIADEPTTALDMTVQAQILALLLALKRERRMGMVLITHDLGAVAGLADQLLIMRGGRRIESGTVREVLRAPRQPYTRELLRDALALGEGGRTDAPVPDPGGAARLPQDVSGPALEVRNLQVRFPVRGRPADRRRELTALAGVDLQVAVADALGVVGESGSGKSTLVRAALLLLRPAAGRIVWLGRECAAVPPAQLRALRRDLPVVFQDPLGSLDPRLTVAQAITEPLTLHEPRLTAAQREARVQAAMGDVLLPWDLAGRYPHQLSGGQCQRVGIARAMILAPRLLICDEPLSALDVTTQYEVMQLLARLRSRTGMGLLFISHNLALIRQLCERVLVLYLGRMMELAPAPRLFEAPAHPYTRELLAAIPSADPDVQPQRLGQAGRGEAPSPLDPPSGCVFRTRCPHATTVCAERAPQWQAIAAGRGVACHHWQDLPAP